MTNFKYRRNLELEGLVSLKDIMEQGVRNSTERTDKVE